jgi:hypothetical protein
VQALGLAANVAAFSSVTVGALMVKVNVFNVTPFQAIFTVHVPGIEAASVPAIFRPVS